MKTLVVEGWRFITHSYAIVNQYQCLELLEHPDITLYHRDIPFFRDNWVAEPGSMLPAQEAALRSIPAPPPDLANDATLRIGFPYDFEVAPNAKRTCVFATTEVKRLHDVQLMHRAEPSAVLPHVECTVITCSNWAAEGFLNSGLPRARLTVVPHGVDTTVFHPLDPDTRERARSRLGWSGRFVVLNVSSASRNKGLDLLLRAVAELAAVHPKLLVSLKGSDALYRSDHFTRETVDSLPERNRHAIADRLVYQGDVLPVSDLARLYQCADVYVAPYRAEGFNIPVLEAAACGLPVICTRGGPTDEFTDDSWALGVDSTETTAAMGRYLEPDYGALVSALSAAIENDGWRVAAASSGPSWVGSRFTWKHAVDTLITTLFAP